MNVYLILFCLWGGEGLLNLGVSGPSSLHFPGNFTQKRQSLVTLQPEIIAKLIPKTLVHVTEMRFSEKIIPKTLVHVIL